MKGWPEMFARTMAEEKNHFLSVGNANLVECKQLGFCLRNWVEKVLLETESTLWISEPSDRDST